MKFVIRHEINGRIRIHCCREYMSPEEADIFQDYLLSLDGVWKAKVYDRTGDAVIFFKGNRDRMVADLTRFTYEKNSVREGISGNTGRRLNQEYREKLIWKLVTRGARRIIMPAPFRHTFCVCRSIPYMVKGLRCLRKKRLEVEVLDATAIAVSIFRRDFPTAGSIMFLLGIGEMLEEWTHKKSVGDLARSMALNVNKAWQEVDGREVLVPVSDVKEGDLLVVRAGNVIPLDGIVLRGEGMVNQASMTGEPVPVRKGKEAYVYGGTVVEEGEITFRVRKTAGSTRMERIVQMIEESEKLKSSAEGKASRLADALVPWSLGGTVLTWLLTRNAAKALSILMVDFSCALKLAMPLAFLSAMREAGDNRITVKGGKYFEAVAQADTVIFDKTGTLTKARPVVAQVIPFQNREADELLRIAACLEEHFPHSMARAVVSEARRRGLIHEEMHSKIDYIVAHGIATYVNGERVIIGSHHFIFEDEGCRIPQEKKKLFHSLPEECSHLYMGIGGELAAVICIEDPVREEAERVIAALREQGIQRIVMMTGDNERTARAIGKKVGVDEWYSEVLPEDKAGYIEHAKKNGRKTIMIGDGINDSPALSAADAGIAISEGAAIAREISDITISEDNLEELLVLRKLSSRLMKRIDQNYRFVIGFNLGLILLGVGGVIMPSASALLHNTSTLAVSLKSMTNLLE